MINPDDLVAHLADYERAMAEAESYRRTTEILEAENDGLRVLIGQLKSELDFYRRHSVELTTKFDTIGGLINEAVAQARQGAYKPNGLVPPKSTAELLQDPIPEFLTKPQNGDSGK